MSSYLSLTQLETLPVQRVTDVVTEFVRNVPLLPAHRLEVIRATQQHSVPCRAKHPRDAASVDPHRERVTDRHAAEQCPRFCSQLGLGRAVRRPQIWGNERWLCLLQKSDSIAGSVCGCAVLLKDKELSRHFTHHGQQCLCQQNIPIIGTINLHPWVNKKQICEAKL